MTFCPSVRIGGQRSLLDPHKEAHMQQLEDMITLMVASVTHGRISIGMLRAQLVSEGMDEEETTLLLEIVALEVKLTHPPTFELLRAERAYKATDPQQRSHLVDVVG